MHIRKWTTKLHVNVMANDKINGIYVLFLHLERRKSNCVKEVEKLKKNRDDRR